MAEAKTAAEDKKKQETVSVTKPFRKLYPWIEEVAKGIIAEALRLKKEPYQKVSLPKHPADLADELISLNQQKGKIEERYAACRERLMPLWAQKGETEISGVKIDESTTLSLRNNEAVGKLPPTLRSQVVRMVPMFDLEAFLKLANDGKIDRDIVRQCLEAEVTVSVTPPKS